MYLQGFDRQFGMDADGNYRSSWLHGGEATGRLRRRVLHDIRQAKRLGGMLDRLTDVEQDVKLLEAHRIHTLHPLEAMVYQRSKRYLKEELEPASWLYRMFAVLVVVMVFLIAGGYSANYGLKKGQITNWTCFLTVCLCLLFELVVVTPLEAWFWYSHLPGLIVSRVGRDLDYAIQAPYKFTTFIPDGPACLVALERRETLAASILLSTLDPPFVNKPLKAVAEALAKKEEVSPANLLQWFRETHQLQQQMERSARTAFCGRVSLLGVGPLLFLPKPLQNILFELFIVLICGISILLVCSLCHLTAGRLPIIP